MGKRAGGNQVEPLEQLSQATQPDITANLSTALAGVDHIASPGHEESAPRSLKREIRHPLTAESTKNIRCAQNLAGGPMRIPIVILSVGLLALGVGCHKTSLENEGTRPAAPTGATANAGNAQATVTWQAPSNDGGRALTGFTVTASPGGVAVTVSGTANSANVTGLANGTTYTFTVVATNALGNSPPSAPSKAVTPATVPGAPTGVSATGGNGEATVVWTAPNDDGGKAIMSYTVTASPSASPVTVDASKRTVTLGGLTNGTAYTFSVVATNAVGDGTASAASAAVTPADGVLTVTPGKAFASRDTPVTLKFTLLGSGGQPVSGQTVTLRSSENTDALSNTFGTTDASGVFSSVVTANSAGTRTFEAQVGSDVFSATGTFIAPCSNLEFVEPATTYTAGAGSDSVVTGDFNGDGKLDLAIANELSDDVSILFGNGDGSFQDPINYAVGTSPHELTLGDFDSDGKLDLAVCIGSTNDVVSVLLNGSNGVFKKATSVGVGGWPTNITVGDFNGDGKPDLVVTTGGDSTGENPFTRLDGNGDGTFKSAVNFGGSVDQDSYFAASGDFNEDGKQDLVVTETGRDSATIMPGNGDGTFQYGAGYGPGIQNYFMNYVTVGDYDWDGKPDISMVDDYNGLTVALGNGDGSFGIAGAYPMNSASDPVVSADFNGDGNPDVTAADRGGVTVVVMLGNGDGTFQSPFSFDAGTGVGSVAAGDFDGDGRVDLAVTSGSDNEVSVLINACQ